MEAGQDSAVKLLNSLIETTLDSAQGYEEAAETTGEGQLKAMFSERCRRRMDLARQLQQEVRTFGAEPRRSESMVGTAHAKLVRLKNAIMGGHGLKAVLDEVERGEDVLKAKFEKALEDADLPTNARQVVTRAYESIRADHDEISRLKHSLH
jgi:uncharacterized protein (TIGR02284 family)